MKFIHTADIHLGATPDVGCSWSIERKNEIWESFRRLIEVVKAEKTDLLLIAGDLFHRQPLVRELKEVDYLFSTIPDTKIVLIAGNHDYIKPESYYLNFPWQGNVITLWNPELERVYIEELNTYIYGLSYHSREIPEPLYHSPVRQEKSYTKDNTEGYRKSYIENKLENLKENGAALHILVAHGGDDKHIPFKKEILASMGYDYIALGHIHKPQVLIKNKMAYAGALEPLDRNDTGSHGFIRGTIDGKKVVCQWQRFALRSYVDIPVEVTENTTQLSLVAQIKELLERQKKTDIFRLQLTGYRDPEVEFFTSPLKSIGNIVEIQDDTKPAYHLERLKEEYRGSLIEEYIAYFEKQPDTEENSKALFYGLAALLETKG